ncbi:MAG: CRTAC1 family protein [Acidobacteria bacterium]|nr:CRTAC1 family protein [Acidobacteriota bacterium]
MRWPVQFTDVAARAGLTQPSVYGEADRKRFIIETNGSGTAFVDYDRDGWVDALVLSGSRLEADGRKEVAWPKGTAPLSRLYRNRRDGTFADVTVRAGLHKVGWASSVCAGDYDSDGWIDLFVTYFGHNVLYRNRGDGRFEDRTAAARVAAAGVRWGSGCSFIDHDRDGDLDLFVANYLAFDVASAPEPGQGANCLWKGIPVNCGPKGLPTDTNLFYRNRGDGTFEDVSGPSRIAAVTGRYPMTAIAADLDADGWTDLYVASDSTAAIFYRNDRDGTFTDVAVPSGAAFNDQGSPQAGMGAAIGDVNGDGLLDLFKTHFADDIPALYLNLGRGLFEDVAMRAGLGVQNRHVQWGGGLPDLDNDGLADVFYVTGHVYPEVERALPQYPYRGPRVVFRNDGNGRFTDVTSGSGPGGTRARSSRGAAFGDYDNDGDIDVLVMNMSEPPSLLRNDYRGGNAWLALRLEGRTSNRTAIGATVTVTAGGRRQARAVVSQASYYSHDDLRLHFGLGRAARADRIEVRWPSGATQVLSSVRARQVLTIREEQPYP